MAINRLRKRCSIASIAVSKSVKDGLLQPISLISELCGATRYNGISLRLQNLMLGEFTPGQDYRHLHFDFRQAK